MRPDGRVLPNSWPGIERVLVKEVNWLGDLVMSLPALRMLRRAFNAARLSVLIRGELAGFFDGIDWIDEVIPYHVRPGIRGWADQSRIVAGLRARRFDLALVFPNSFRSALWMRLAGVPRCAGYATDRRRFLLTDSTVPRASAIDGHQSFYWLGIITDTVGISPLSADSVCQMLEVSPERVTLAKEWLASRRCNRNGPLIAISAAAAYGPAKEWPQDSFAELIDRLDQVAGAQCVLLGTASERSRCEQLAARTRAGAIIAAGATEIGELKGLLSLCDGFAGNDSGAMHLAAALGIPTVGIFGSTNPARTGPVGPKATTIYHPIECSPCLNRTCRFGHYHCLKSIAPGEIIEALDRLGAFATRAE